MKKIIDFGKIDFCGTGEPRNTVTIEIELQETENGQQRFSASGNVWEPSKRDIVCGGQCLDELAPYFKKNKLFLTIYRLWQNYHLNDMHAGTPQQEKFIKEHEQEIKQTLAEMNASKKYSFQYASHYDAVCEVLKKYGLYEVDYKGTPYKYGHAWLYEPIPQEDIEIIKQIIQAEK